MWLIKMDNFNILANVLVLMQMLEFAAKPEKVSLTQEEQTFFPFLLSTDWMKPTHLGESD